MMMVAMMMVVAMPTVMMAMMSPMHFRRRQFGVLLNRRCGAGIAERQRVGALGRRCERKHDANGGESQNFRKLHELLSLGRVPRLRRIARRNAARNLRPAT